MTAWCVSVGILLVGLVPGWAQFDGPSSPGVSVSLIRLFGTNFAFTARVEYQLLNRSNKELVNLPMSLARLDNRICMELDLARMRNQVQPDALAQIKPLGMEQLITILRPDLRATCQIFPRLRAFVKLPMPPNEAEAFAKPGKMERTRLGQEKMQGFDCTRYRVVATDEQGGRHEATVWNATGLRDFPLCVATREGQETVVMRFSQIQFVRPDSAKFEPPAGYVEYADMGALINGPAQKYLTANKTAMPAPGKGSTSSTKPKPAPGTSTRKK